MAGVHLLPKVALPNINVLPTCIVRHMTPCGLHYQRRGWALSWRTRFWHYASIAPSTKAMRGVAIEDQGWRKRITPNDGVHVKAGMGRKMVNPCFTCEDAELDCMTEYCGQCRSRPVVRSAKQVSYLGMGCSQVHDTSPRTFRTNVVNWRLSDLLP